MLKFLLDTVTELPHDAPLHKALTEAPLKTSPSLLRLGLSFVGLMLALWLVIWLLKKLSGSKLGFFHHGSSIKVVEHKALSPKTMLYIVDYNGQKVLVTESSLHIKLKDIEECGGED